MSTDLVDIALCNLMALSLIGPWRLVEGGGPR